MNCAKTIFATCCLAAVAGLALSANDASAANIALGKSYSYTTMPTFGAGLFYRDEFGTTGPNTDAGSSGNHPTEHLGYTSAGAFDTGELTNGAGLPDGTGWGIAPGTNVVDNLVSWQGGSDASPLPTDIVIDLGAVFNDIVSVDVSTYRWDAAQLNRADDVTVSFSNDNVTYGAGTLFALSNGTNDVLQTDVLNVGSVSARYVRLAFDGDNNHPRADGSIPDKYNLSEIAVQQIPEPGSLALLGLGGLAVVLRRRGC